jgi:hypothetical protein
LLIYVCGYLHLAFGEGVQAQRFGCHVNRSGHGCISLATVLLDPLLANVYPRMSDVPDMGQNIQHAICLNLTEAYRSKIVRNMAAIVDHED